MLRATLLSAGSLVCAGALVLAACGGDEAGIGAGDASAEAAPTPTDDGGPIADAADDGGELITDGGSNIDLDAGDDAGPDAAPCNTLTNDAPTVTSTCVSRLPPLNGGALVAGTYFLTGVAALGSQTFCQSTFVPVSFKERVEITLGASAATFEAVIKIAGLPDRRSTSTAIPGPGNTSPATVTNVCPNTNTGRVGYTSVVNANGKQILLLLLPYGKGLGIYRLEKP